MVALALLLACAAPSAEAPQQPLLARAEVGDVVVAGGSSALGAVAGAIVGTGLAAAGLAVTADFDATQPTGDQVLLNNATGFFVVAGAPALAVAGAGVGGAVGDGLVTALGAGFGAVVGSGAAGLLGLVLLPPNNDAATVDAVIAAVVRGGVVAVVAGVGAAVGGAGARAAFDPEALE